MAKNVKISYAGSTIQINVEDSATVREVLQSPAVRSDPTMTFGDNYNVVSNEGVAQPLDRVIADGAHLFVESRANTKG